MNTMSAHCSASSPSATWYESPSPPVTSPGAAPQTLTSYGMLARVLKTCAGIPTSSGFAPSSTRTATRPRRLLTFTRLPAAGDPHDRAGRVRRIRAQQVRHGTGDLVRLPGPSHRDAARSLDDGVRPA